MQNIHVLASAWLSAAGLYALRSLVRGKLRHADGGRTGSLCRNPLLHICQVQVPTKAGLKESVNCTTGTNLTSPAWPCVCPTCKLPVIGQRSMGMWDIFVVRQDLSGTRRSRWVVIYRGIETPIFVSVLRSKVQNRRTGRERVGGIGSGCLDAFAARSAASLLWNAFSTNTALWGSSVKRKRFSAFFGVSVSGLQKNRPRIKLFTLAATYFTGAEAHLSSQIINNFVFSCFSFHISAPRPQIVAC